MSTHPTPFSADQWSQSQLAKLEPGDRESYDAACDVAESQLRDGFKIQDVVSAISCSKRILPLVLLNIGKCVLENRSIADSGSRVGEVLQSLNNLDDSSEAIDEFWKFVELEKGSPDMEMIDRNPYSLPPTHEFVSPLASHGQTRLLLARRTSLDRIECVKLINLAGIAQPALVAQLKDEASRASKLSHPGLVQVFDAGDAGDSCYLCMEYMNGGSLADRIATGPLPWQMVVRLMATAGRAIESLHTKARLAHGDIKPGNMLFTRTVEGEEIFKIGDFGLSSELCHVADETSPESKPVVFGTPGYLAPELLSKSLVGSQAIPFDDRVTADVFALGITAYEALTGRLPYQVGNSVDPFGVLKNPYISVGNCVAEVPSVVAYVIKRACAIDRKERYVSAKEFARSLEQCLVGEQAQLHPVTRPTTVTAPEPVTKPAEAGISWGRRLGPWLVPLACSACALLILAYLTRSSPEDFGNLAAGPVSHVRSRTPARDRSAAPTTDVDLDTAVLEGKGLSVESARAIKELNHEWFAALRKDERTQSLSEQMLTVLANSDEAHFGRQTFQNSPHLAPLTAFPHVHTHQPFVDAVRSESRVQPCYTNLVIQHPAPQAVAAQISSWVANHDALAALMEHGLYGADRMVAASDKDAQLQSWIKDILVTRIDSDPDNASQWMAVFLENHEAIRTRLRDTTFRTKFSDTWERFVVLLSAEPKAADSFAFNGGAWDVLSYNHGDDLIRRFQLLPVAMLTGDDAFPADADLRQAVVEHLLKGYAPVVSAFSDRNLRQSPQFCNLIRMRLPHDVFASICSQIEAKRATGKHLDIVEQVSRKTRDHLTADHAGVDVNRWAAESVIPHLIYVRIGLKVVASESLYDVEKQALLKRLAFDAVTYGVPVAGERLEIPSGQVNAFVQAFPGGYSIGENAVRELVRKDQLKALEKFNGSSGNSIEAGMAQQAGLRKEMDQVLEVVRHQGDQAVLDITNAKMLFETLTIGRDEPLPRVDLRQVRFLRLPDGRLFPGVTTTRGVFAVPGVKNFFDNRWMILTSAAADADAKDTAYRQLVSAWLLLGATNQIPLHSPE